MSQGGHIVKPKGKRRTWAIMYRDPDGRLRWEGKFASKGDGQRRLNEVLGQIDKGVYARPPSMTFEQFAENWLVGRRKIRGSTESGYGSLIRRQLIPRLGSVFLAALKLDSSKTSFPPRRSTMLQRSSEQCWLAGQARAPFGTD